MSAELVVTETLLSIASLYAGKREGTGAEAKGRNLLQCLGRDSGVKAITAIS